MGFLKWRLDLMYNYQKCSKDASYNITIRSTVYGQRHDNDEYNKHYAMHRHFIVAVSPKQWSATRTLECKFLIHQYLLNQLWLNFKICLLHYYTWISVRWHYNLVYSLLANKYNFCRNIVSTFLCIQTCKMFADSCSVCTIRITIKHSWTFSKLKLAHCQAPDSWRLQF